MIEFAASGPPRAVSRAIEEFATAQGNVSALVVPWESQGGAVSMAVTAVKSDGWAIEHTNLGTITLTDLGNDRTRVVVASHGPDRVDTKTLTTLFDRFAHQVQRQFEVSA